MTNREEYHRVYRRIAGWIRQGKVWQEHMGNIQFTDWTKLDWAIFKLFGVDFTPTGHPFADRNTSIGLSAQFNTMNLDWLHGPYGLVLFKALIKKKQNEQ